MNQRVMFVLLSMAGVVMGFGLARPSQPTGMMVGSPIGVAMLAISGVVMLACVLVKRERADANDSDWQAQ